jgi:hypothetical protein
MPALHELLRLPAALTTLARTALSADGRAMMREIRQLQAALPHLMATHALPELLQTLTPSSPDWQGREEAQVRALVDAMARADLASPLGLCLRRSLLRYHFLLRVGIPLTIVLAMRKRREGEPPGLAGHAWNELHGAPYHEREEDMLGFTVVYRWPSEQ